jgi:hypothetical protein
MESEWSINMKFGAAPNICFCGSYAKDRPDFISEVAAKSGAICGAISRPQNQAWQKRA